MHCSKQPPARKDLRGNVEAKRFRRFHINHELDRLHRQISRLLALKDTWTRLFTQGDSNAQYARRNEPRDESRGDCRSRDRGNFV